jgi:prepilin peptidase CpaA
MPGILQAALLVLVICAGIVDIKWRRMPNWMAITGLATGFVLNGYFGGVPGLRAAVLGASLGAALFICIYVSGGMGAGDVKLLAAVGAMVGPVSLMIIFVLTGIVGGVAALILLFFRGAVITVLARTIHLVARWMHFDWVEIARASDRRRTGALSLPYGAVVASGTLLFLIALNHPVR